MEDEEEDILKRDNDKIAYGEAKWNFGGRKKLNLSVCNRFQLKINRFFRRVDFPYFM